MTEKVESGTTCFVTPVGVEESRQMFFRACGVVKRIRSDGILYVSVRR